MRRFWTLTYLAVAVATLSQAATISYYSNSADFLANSIVQSNPLIHENFDNNTTDFTTFNLLGGDVGMDRGFFNGKFQDQVDLLPLQATTITLNNGNKMWGLGADFDLTMMGPGSHVAFLLQFENAAPQLLTAILGANTGNYNGPFFFGFVSDTAFKAVTIGSLGILGRETYTMDNLLISAPSVVGDLTATPEPTTFALMGGALLGLGLLRRRCSKKN